MQQLALLLPLAFLFLLAGALPLSALCCVLITAQYGLAGEPRKAAGVAALSGAAVALLLGSLPLGIVHAALASGGILVAALMRRGWSFGARLALVTGLLFVTSALFTLANWDTWRHGLTVFINARIAEMNASEVSNDQAVEFAKWWDVNSQNLAFGSLFGTILYLSAFTLSVLDRGQQPPDARLKRRPTGFQRMRVPDWVVWAAIAAAALWFADQRWPNDVLRAVAWNLAIGLSFLYWLNGFSILLYALSIFKASALAVLLVFAGFVLFSSLLPALTVMGFFDTWYEFRMRFRRAALLRRISQRSADQDDQAP